MIKTKPMGETGDYVEITPENTPQRVRIVDNKGMAVATVIVSPDGTVRIVGNGGTLKPL